MKDLIERFRSFIGLLLHSEQGELAEEGPDQFISADYPQIEFRIAAQDAAWSAWLVAEEEE